MNNITNSLKECSQIGKRYNIRVKVLSVRNNPHPKKVQEGVLIDRYNEKINYIIWHDSNLSQMQLNKIYTLMNVKLVEFQNKRQIHLDKWSKIMMYNIQAQIAKPKYSSYKKRRRRKKYYRKKEEGKVKTNNIPIKIYRHSNPILLLVNGFIKLIQLIKKK